MNEAYKKSVCSAISILMLSLCVLCIVFGVICVTAFSSDGNWGFIILGILAISFAPIVCLPVGIVFAILAIARGEKRVLASTVLGINVGLLTLWILLVVVGFIM